MIRGIIFISLIAINLAVSPLTLQSVLNAVISSCCIVLGISIALGFILRVLIGSNNFKSQRIYSYNLSALGLVVGLFLFFVSVNEISNISSLDAVMGRIPHLVISSTKLIGLIGFMFIIVGLVSEIRKKFRITREAV